VTDRPVGTGGSAAATSPRRDVPGADTSPRRAARRSRRPHSGDPQSRDPQSRDPRSRSPRSRDPRPGATDGARPPGGDDVLELRLGGVHLHLPVLPTAWLLVAIGVLLTGARLARGWYWQDDFSLLAQAAGRPLGPDLLLSGYNGHLVPGTWLLAWLIDTVAPMEWWPAATASLALTAGVNVAALAMFRRLFGTRPAILLPLALVCTTTLTVGPALWWAAAMQWLPVTLALAAGVYFHAGFLRTGRTRDAAGAVLSVVFGLLFFEKALTTVLVLALFTVAYGVPGPLLRRPWRALREHPRYWAVHAVVAAGFLALYLGQVTVTTQPARSGGSVLTLIRYQVLETLLPSFLGGPLTWFDTWPTTIAAWPNPPVLLAVLSWLVALLAVAVSVRLRRGAWRAWVLLLVFYGISAGLVAQARLGVIGPMIGRDQRYLTDLAVMLPLCLALAWLPLRAGLDRQEDTADPLVGSPGLTAVGAVVVVLMVAGSAVSGERFMTTWTRNPSQEWFTNLSTGVQDAAGPVRMFPHVPVPPGIMAAAFGADRDLENVAPLLPEPPVFTDQAEAFVTPDAEGRLHPGTVRGAAAVVVQPSACGVPGRSATGSFPVPSSGWNYVIKLGYLAQADTAAQVVVGGTVVPVRLRQGLHDLYVFLPHIGPAGSVELAGLQAGVCLGSAVLGQAVPS
jgi:hypothetical protein